MKKTIMLTSLILGYVIGAGFVSGREIVVFFDCGWAQLFLMLTIFAISFFCICFLFLYIGHKKIQFGKIKKYYDIFLFFSNIIMSGCLLAGTKCIGDNISPYVGYLFVLITLVIALLVSTFGVGVLQKVSAILVPIIIMLLVVTFSSGGQYKIYTNFKPLYPIFYVSMNLCLSGYVLSKIGEKSEMKHIIFSCIISSIILATIIFLIRINLFNQTFEYIDMPILAFVMKKGEIYLIIYNIILYLGIFTSLIFTLLTTQNYLKDKKSITKFLVLSIITLIGIMPFGTIVEKAYPIMGVVGTVFILFFTYHIIVDKKVEANLTKLNVNKK